MCEPATFVAMGMSAEAAATAATVASVATTAVSIGGTALSAINASNQAQQAKDTANFNAAVQRNNQIIANRKAEDALVRGKEASDLQRAKGEALKARQTVSLAGQGVDVTTGSSVDLLADTGELAEFDAQKIKNNAAREATDHRNAAQNAGAQAGLFSAQAAGINPTLAGTSTLLSGVGSVASKWYKGGGTVGASPTTSSGSRSFSTRQNFVSPDGRFGAA